MSSDLFRLTPVDWSDRILFSSCLLFLYDFVVTVPLEVKHIWLNPRLRRTWTGIATLSGFGMLRYAGLILYLFVLSALGLDSWDKDVCSRISNIAQILESLLLFAWAVAVWLRFSRVWIIYSDGFLRWTIAPAMPLGLVCPILGLTISTPSMFPHCRRWEDEQVSRLALAQPCLRAAFDAVALVIMLALLRHRAYDVQSPSHFGTAKRILQRLTSMDSQDLLAVLVLLIIEIVFLQVKTARTEARIYVSPLVDA
ncbi:hypothetical protein DL96DRAFT_1634790 [Flagelloscypha sp. PMI_526]|nr:hypothetical protein DL96DRAFT_1634790 [Flagelloscypha sp. PMI_526]